MYFATYVKPLSILVFTIIHARPIYVYDARKPNEGNMENNNRKINQERQEKTVSIRVGSARVGSALCQRKIYLLCSVGIAVSGAHICEAF